VVPWDKRWFEDADKFRPERWDNDLAKRLPRCAYYPFVEGPRICIGMHFAMMEAVLVLANVASRYRLELAPGYTLKLNPSVTLRPQGGMPMILHERYKADRVPQTSSSVQVNSD
jgi:cytochrome P450